MTDELDFLLAPNEQAPEGPSPQQRFRVHVPCVKTTMSLGAKAPGDSVREVDTGAPNYTGFGVDTEGHIFMSARGKTPDENMLKLQSVGEMTFMTESSLTIASNASTTLATPQHVLMAGNKGIVLAAGTHLPPPTIEVPDSNDGPATPAYVKEMSTAIEQIKSTWKTVDMGVAALEIAMIACDWRLNVRETKLFPAFKITAMSLLEGYLEAWGGGILEATLPEKGSRALQFGAEGDCVIYGENGLIMGTKGSAGLFSTLGTSIASTAGVGIMAPLASMTSSFDTTVKSVLGGTTVSAKKTLELLGGNGVEMASRKGNVAIRGTQVIIGSKKGADKQAATKFVGSYGEYMGMYAKNNLRLSGGKSAILRATKTAVDGNLVTVSGKKSVGIASKDVRVRGDKSVSINAGGFGINLSSSKLELGKAADLPKEPVFENPREHESLAALGSDTPMADMKEYMSEIKQAVADYEDKWYAWLEKCEELQTKDSLIEIKDAKIRLKVKSAKIDITSSKVQAMNALVVK